MKQTFGLGKLRSRNSDHALAELNWSIVALTMVELLALKEQSVYEIPPEHSSVSEALRAIRHSMRHWYEESIGDAILSSRRADATKDDYERSTKKAARYQPNFKDKPATAKQKRAYNALQIAA